MKRSGLHPPRRQRGRGLAGQTGLGRVFMAPPWHGQIRQARVQRSPLVLASVAQRGQGRGVVPTEASQAQAVQTPLTALRSLVPRRPAPPPRSYGSSADSVSGLTLSTWTPAGGLGWWDRAGEGRGAVPPISLNLGSVLQTNLRPANSICSEEAGSLLPACTRGDLAVPLEEGHQCPDHRGRAGPSHPSHTHICGAPHAGCAGDTGPGGLPVDSYPTRYW